MQFTGRHSALVEYCLSAITGGGIFHSYFNTDELTEETAEDVSLRVP